MQADTGQRQGNPYSKPPRSDGLMAVVYGSLRIVAISAILWNTARSKKTTITVRSSPRREEHVMHLLTTDMLVSMYLLKSASPLSR